MTPVKQTPTGHHVHVGGQELLTVVQARELWGGTLMAQMSLS